MSSDKIEAERRQIVSVVLALYNTGRPAHGDAVDHIMASPVMRHHFDGLQAAITKANEELRAEVELAKQEGVAETLQQIDCLTGGDGEYRLSTCPDRNCPDEDAMRKKIVARFDDLRATIDRLTKERDEAVGTLRWAHDTLYEINPSNYDHDEVCKLNDASVEVILGIAPLLGEKHGKIDAWWHSRIEGQRTRLSAMQDAIDEAVRRADTETPFKTHVIVSDVVEPLRPFATKPEPEADPLGGEKALLAELALLYNHKDDDSRQFTRWQMAVAIRHGMALASRGLVRGEGV